MQSYGKVQRRVLVVGGGIAGFAMLRALDQRGIAAVLVERLNGPPDAGLGLNLPGNAVRALRELGVGDALKERGMPILRRVYSAPTTSMKKGRNTTEAASATPSRVYANDALALSQ